MGRDSLSNFLILSTLLCCHFETGFCLPDPENFLDSIHTSAKRSISVSSVCSNNSAYVKYPDTGDPTEYSCITDKHSPRYMHDDDPSFTTYWQSEISATSLGNFTEQWIVLNLTDKFLVRSVLITFTSPLVASDVLSDVRPNALVIERWVSEEQTYQPWRYYSSNCLSSFSQALYQPINGPSLPPAVPVCKEQYYSGDASTIEPNKPHQFVLFSPFTDISDDYLMNKTELDFHTTSAVRVRLVLPAAQTSLASYYTVSSLQVNGSCLCYGHADVCMGQNKAVCDCIHNTAGDQCDHCLPLYNSAPWQVHNPLTNFSCLRCDCNNNADSCIFNETLSAAVCVGCHSNSYGSTCEMCEDGYYNIGSTEGDTVCTECQCTGEGLLNVTTSCNSLTGQCDCKSHVTGLSCDQCQDGYWNLTRDNVDGCQECSHCDTAGTVGLSLPMCHVISGQCECKANVIGLDCSMCMPGTFNLSAANQDGCTKCACVEGASRNTSCELLADNQCLCVEHVEGRTCDTPSSGYFIPKLDYIRVHLDQARTVVLPSGGEYIISLSPPSASISLTSLNAPSTECGLLRGQLLADRVRVCLEMGVVHSINSTTNTTVTFIPAFSDVLNTSEGRSCLHQVLDGGERNFLCADIEYSVMAAVYASALECQCDVVGSYNPGQCDPLSGQCYCKPGVTGRSCDSCMVSHYNMSMLGCTACICNSNGSMESSCDKETGTCRCLSHVTGEKCDTCLPEYYGHSSGKGCSRCECSKYSLDNDCTDDGVCACTTGVGGDTCHQCLDSYHSLSMEGCTLCNCSELGSINNTCLSPAGTCTCKRFVHGDKCDACVTGFHQLWHADKPCKVCYCYGHALQCSTQSGWSKLTISDRWTMLNDSILQPRWFVIDSDGNELPTSVELYHSDEDVQQVTVYTADGSSAAGPAYFSATHKYLGDHRALYYQLLTFTLSYHPVSSQSPLQARVIMRGRNLDYELWSHPLTAPSDVPTPYRLRISELELVRNDTLQRATLPQLLQLLNNLTELLIPASFDRTIGSACVLHSVAMETGVRDFNSESRQLSNIEQCLCPTGYQGDQCESCAEGYRRRPAGNDSPTSDCVPCDCSSGSCDLLTGQCYCDAHSTGSRCEMCESGFYGRPALGEACQECICYSTSNNTCVSEADGLPTCLGCSPGHTGRHCQNCLLGYYGDPPAGVACEPCDCNGRSNKCDASTGVCVGCEANTTGSHCELCAVGFYGNASIGCSECKCASAGYEQVCHPVTGDCQCLPGLDVTYNCTQCIPGYHNLSSTGCLPCMCDSAGTLEGSVCNMTGQCECKENAVGADCSLCASGYFRHAGECVACDCDIEGSLANTSCDPLTGQCECLHSGFTGRSCDRCLADTQGVFPSCYPCGECYSGWRELLMAASNHIDSTFSQLHNLALRYGEWSPEELESILFIVERNISLSQDLYMSASNLINSTNQLNLDLLLLYASLNLIGQSVDQLANQLSDHSHQFNSLVDRFENPTSQSAMELQTPVEDAAGRSEELDQVLADYQLRLTESLSNLTVQQQMYRALRMAASAKMDELATANASLVANQTTALSLADVLTDLTIAVVKEKTTLSNLNNSLVSGGDVLESLFTTLSNVSTSLRGLRAAVMESFNMAMYERTEVDSLSHAALASKQNIHKVLTAINQHVANINQLQLDLERQWTLYNKTERLLVNTSWSLDRAHSLHTNISNTSLPDTSGIERLLASIHTRHLTSEQEVKLTDELETAVGAAHQYINGSLQAEFEVAQVSELVESALRDLSVAKQHINESEEILDNQLTGLHGEINHTLSTMQETLREKSHQCSRIVSQLDLFKYLTNQIRECADNSTWDLMSLNVSVSLLEEEAVRNEQIVSEVSGSQSQLFMRLQLQAIAIQRSQITLSESERVYNAVSGSVEDKQRLLRELMEEHNSNSQRLAELEGNVEKAESRLMSLLDSYEDGPSCEH